MALKRDSLEGNLSIKIKIPQIEPKANFMMNIF